MAGCILIQTAFLGLTGSFRRAVLLWDGWEAEVPPQVVEAPQNTDEIKGSNIDRWNLLWIKIILNKIHQDYDGTFGIDVI